ncbi:alpha/beta fold hydrolase [Erythrobacter sp. WG]|uniref:alpha/beta fold hydrolase n=1 Tax=Erythrobacter sp. WG TaxID=2985510 RepID=UPI00226EC162|nr:alpha/beta fold hydrolase [Erythrobacter sp. WG]MCX9147146.1 alpha/beta fold hydrolase [Erythrobacter sp. WG]
MEGVANGIRWSAQGRPHEDQASVLFIHGAGANRAAWWQQFAAFAPAHHVIAYDLPGFGESDAADPARLPEQMIEAAVAVLAAAGATRAKVVCQSLGGWTGVRLALARPDLVESLVLCCTLAGIAHPPGLQSFAQARVRMGQRGPAALALTEGFIAAAPLMTSLYSQLGAYNPPADPALAEKLFGPDALVPLDQLAAIAAPVLIIAGEHDPIWPPAALAGLLPHFADGRMTVLPGAGHSPYFEEPASFNALIAEFLGLTI